jgi:hypothetical protein
MSEDLPKAPQDAEIVALSEHPSLWRLYDRALARTEHEGWTPLEDLAAAPAGPGPISSRSRSGRAAR